MQAELNNDKDSRALTVTSFIEIRVFDLTQEMGDIIISVIDDLYFDVNKYIHKRFNISDARTFGCAATRTWLMILTVIKSFKMLFHIGTVLETTFSFFS